MSISKTTTDIDTLKFNYLTQSMYEAALDEGEIESDELYLVPYEPNYTVSMNWITIQSSDTFSPSGPTSSGYYYYSNSTSFTADFPDYLKVVYNNTEYICEKHISGTYASYGAENYRVVPSTIDFSEYPFNILIIGSANTNNKMWEIFVANGNNFTLQIDRGYQTVTTSSDFDKAVLYVLNGGGR